METTNEMLPTGETHDPDFIKFESFGSGITLYAYKLLMQPDTILKITDAKSDYQIPLNMVFFQDCPFFKKTSKTSEKIEILQNSKPVQKTFTVHRITFNSCSFKNRITAATVQKYLNHYFLKLHSPSFKLEPTFEDCGELLALAQLIEDREVCSTSYDFFKNNIKLENFGQAITIGLYDSVAKFIASSVETMHWRQIEYVLERLSESIFMKILNSMKDEYFMVDGYISNKLGKVLIKLYVQIVKRNRSEIYVRKEDNRVESSYRMFDTNPVEYDFSKRVDPCSKSSVIGSKSTSKSGLKSGSKIGSKSGLKSVKSSKVEEEKNSNSSNLVDMLLECATLCKINIAMTRTIVFQELNGVLKPEELGYACSVLFSQQELKWNLNLKFFHDLEDSRILRQKTVDEVMNMWNLNAIEDLDQPPGRGGPAAPLGGIFQQYMMPDILGDLHPAGFGLDINQQAGVVRAGGLANAVGNGQMADGLMRRLERRANAADRRTIEENEGEYDGTDENGERIIPIDWEYQGADITESIGTSSIENTFSLPMDSTSSNKTPLNTQSTHPLNNFKFKKVDNIDAGSSSLRRPDHGFDSLREIDNSSLATSARMLEQSMLLGSILEQNSGNIRSDSGVDRHMATRSGRLSLPSRRSSSQPLTPSGGKKSKLDKTVKKEPAVTNQTSNVSSSSLLNTVIGVERSVGANSAPQLPRQHNHPVQGFPSPASSNPLRRTPASTDLLEQNLMDLRRTLHGAPAVRATTANVTAAMNQLRRQEDQARRRRDELRRRARRDNGIYRGHQYQAHPAQQPGQYMSLRRSVRAEIMGRGCDDDKPVSFYYEVKILYLETDQKIFGIGLGSANFDTNADVMVGWRENSYGYHSDDGGFFENEGHASQQRGEIYDKGDVIGCGYSKDHSVIYFTKNGVHLHSIRNFADIKYHPIMTFKVDYTQKATEVLLLEKNEWVFKNQRFLVLESGRTGAGDGMVSVGIGSQPEVDENGHHDPNRVFESYFGKPPTSPLGMSSGLY